MLHAAPSRARLTARVGEAPMVYAAPTTLDRWRRDELALLAACSSLCLDDMAALPENATLISEARERVDAVAAEYDEGMFTERERYNKAVDPWGAAWDRQPNARTNNPLRALCNHQLLTRSHARSVATTRGTVARVDGDIVDVSHRLFTRTGAWHA
jgi:hypothetical protein